MRGVNLPSLGEIRNEIISAKTKAQDSIRKKYLKKLADYTGRDTLIYASDFTSPKIVNIPASTLSITTQDLQGFMSALNGLKGKNLDIIIHSPGGSAEATEQIVQYLRSKYDHIRLIVPQNAMSAATMLACACDEIIMGKHSALGPIDPQVSFPTANGQFTAPAQTIISEFEQAKKETKNDPSIAPLWMAKVQNIPFGFLQFCENSMKLSEERVAHWLKTYMFKKDRNKNKKAKDIARWLADHKLHKTHGKPISMQEAKQKGLKVTFLEDDDILQDLVLSVHHATLVTFETTNCVKFIENHLGKGQYLQITVEPVKVPIK